MVMLMSGCEKYADAYNTDTPAGQWTSIDIPLTAFNGYDFAHMQVMRITTSVLPAKRFSWRPAIEPEEKIAHLNARIRKYAKEHQIPYADYYSALVSPKDRSLKEGHSVDGVHPNVQGYAVMEKVIMPLLK